MQVATIIESPLEIFETPDMATATELTTQLGNLETRVNENIKFFWVAMGAGFVWLGGLSLLLYNLHTDVKSITLTQADAPSRIVAKLLSAPEASSSEVAARLGAASEILETYKIGATHPDASALKTVSATLSQVQNKYPDLPQVWQTTGTFISYKSDALLPSSSKTAVTAKGIPCTAEMGGIGFVFSNCEVNLEDLAKHVYRNTVNGSAPPFTFVNCIVHYGGGHIPAKHLTFVNCVLRFEVPTVPPPEGIATMRQLTSASDDKAIDIPLA